MAQIHGGQLAARQLQRAGIDTLFGVVAGPMIELFAGGQTEGLRVVGCRHEINAGFMASAWGWQKQRPGVLAAGSGPAEYVEQPGEIRPALDRALSADKLAVVHVRVNPKATRMGGTNYLQ
jgi:thiamine pyrophosphate-dependent acetolactate synthase large subunit-like protein